MNNVFKDMESALTSATSVEKWSRWRMIKSILLLGIPLMIGELGSIAQQFADTIMVGHHSTTELAAAGFVNSIFYFVIFLTLGMSYASTPLIGKGAGCGNWAHVIKTFWESVCVNLLIGGFFFILLLCIYCHIETLFFNGNTILHQQPIEILDFAKKYMIPLMASIPFMTLFYAGKQYMDACGNTIVSMLILLFSNILNIILNWCFIWGHCGFPELGLTGAGYATLISRIAQLLLISIAVVRSPIMQKRLDKFNHYMHPTWDGIMKQIRMGLPISVQLGLEIGIFNVCGIFMGWLGALPLAAHQAMYTISTLMFQVLYGIGAAGTILISHFYGIKAWANIKRAASMAFCVGLVCTTVISFLVCLLFEPLASFLTNDTQVITYMKLILPWLVMYQLGDCTQIVYANALRGLENTKSLAYIAIFSYIVICIPICYLSAFQIDWTYSGVNGVWAGIPIGLLIAGILFYGCFIKYVKRESKITK